MIDKDTLISDVLKENLLTIFVFKKYGMGCPTCDIRFEETLEVGAKRHNVDVDTLVEELNKYVK